MTNANGHIGSLKSIEPRAGPVTLDRSTQTDPVFRGQDAVQDVVSLSRCVKSLELEDALPPGQPVEGTRAKLHRVPGMEEEDEEQDEDDEAGGEQEKELSWTSSVEEPIQPTTIRGLQREDYQDGSSSPEEVASPSASVRTSDPNLGSRCGPLATIQEGQKAPLCVSSLHHRHLHNHLLSCDWTAWLMSHNSTLSLNLICVTANPSCSANPLIKHSASGCQVVIRPCYRREPKGNDMLCHHITFHLFEWGGLGKHKATA